MASTSKKSHTAEKRFAAKVYRYEDADIHDLESDLAHVVFCEVPVCARCSGIARRAKRIASQHAREVHDVEDCQCQMCVDVRVQ